MVGNVDDVALEERDGRLVAVGLLRGPGAWAHRQPGALGSWGRAIWRRLDPREDPRPLVLAPRPRRRSRLRGARRPLGRRLPGGSDGLELWLRRHVVGRIPGARGGDHPFGGDLPAVPRQETDLDLTPDAHLLSGLLGARVVRPDGSDAGVVVEVRAVQVTRMSSRVGPLVVTSVVHGPRRLGGSWATARTRGWAPSCSAQRCGGGTVTTPRPPGVTCGPVDWAAATVHLHDGAGR